MSRSSMEIPVTTSDRVVILDQDGTLYPSASPLTNELRTRSVQWLGASLGLSGSEVKVVYVQLRQRSPNLLCGLASFGLSPEAYLASVFDVVDPSVHLVSDARLRQTLAGLRARCFVVTLASQKYSRALQRHLAIDDLLESTYFAVESPPTYSKAEPYRAILESVHVRPQDVWVVGDDYEVDIKPALDFGCSGVLISSAPAPVSENCYVIRELSELPHALNAVETY